jgi:hypothetical protein
MLTLPVVAVGVLALTGVAAAPASAATASGTGTLTISLSSLSGLSKGFVIAVPSGDQSVIVDKTAGTATIVYPVTGGTADVTAGTGSVQYDGGTTVIDYINGHTLNLDDLRLDVANKQLDLTPEHGSEIPFLDVVGTTSSVSGATQTFSASALAVDPAGAAYLNSALGASAFHAGDQVGTFTTTFSL